jgi:cell wall assembly regulator SMI1
MSIIATIFLAAGAMNMQVQIESTESAATEKHIATVEAKIGAKFPADYRAFLSKYNGGKPRASGAEPGDVVFSIKWEKQPWAAEYGEAFLQSFYSLDEKSTSAWSGAEEAFIEQRRIPADLCPIAYDRGSNQILLGISGSRSGKIYFWAKDFEPFEDVDEPGYENIGFVANSFSEFLEKLRPLK